MPDDPAYPAKEKQEQPPTDYRRIRRRTDRQMLWLVLGGLLIIGGGLIFLIYGKWALVTGLLCLIPGAGLILFLWGLLSLIERWVGD
jgi:hypothetical protein